MTPAARPARSRKSPKGTPGPPPPPPAPGISGFRLGKSDKRHPPIGLGLWALGRWTREDEDRTSSTLRRALELGVRWLDTAEVYGTGRSERLLGDVLSRAGEIQPPVFLTTKLSWEHLRPSQVRPSLLGSLQRLGRSSVDLYLIHAPDPRVPVAGTMGALEALWKEGRIGAIGVSNFSVQQLEAAQAALTKTEIVANQVIYNLFDRNDGDAVLEYCRTNGIVVEGYTPMARGLLTGRYLDGQTPRPDVAVRTHDLFGEDRFPGILERARQLQALATKEKVPMASLALHWLARKGVAPVVGASRPEQIEETLRAWAHRPSDAALDRADEISRGALA